MKSLMMVLPETEVRDFPQCKIQVQTSITFVTIKTPQLDYNSFINRQVQIDEIAYLVCEYHLNETNWQIKANLGTGHYLCQGVGWQ